MSADEAVMARLERTQAGELAISCVALAEVVYGLRKLEARLGSDNAGLRRKSELFERLMLHIDVLPWDADAAEAYAAERVACESDGQILDHADLMILAHAASIGATLVTRDTALQRRDRKGPHKARVIAW